MVDQTFCPKAMALGDSPGPIQLGTVLKVLFNDRFDLF
jgi:uncharacterized membrane protein YczE